MGFSQNEMLLFFFVLHLVMDSATCVKIASKYKDPSEAAHALIQESSKRWMTKSNYVDDITVIVVFLGDGIRMVALGA